MTPWVISLHVSQWHIQFFLRKYERSINLMGFRVLSDVDRRKICRNGHVLTAFVAPFFKPYKFPKMSVSFNLLTWDRTFVENVYDPFTWRCVSLNRWLAVIPAVLSCQPKTYFGVIFRNLLFRWDSICDNRFFLSVLFQTVYRLTHFWLGMQVLSLRIETWKTLW